MNVSTEQEETHTRLNAYCAELEMIRGSFGLHVGHTRRFVEPHWIVCSCGKRAIARPNDARP